jgi:hypothetical protein
MGFLDDLSKGLPGLKLAIPNTWRRQEEQERRAVLVDPDHRVGWHILHAPWRLDLREDPAGSKEQAGAFRRDLERHARYGFEQHYTQVPQPRPAPSQVGPPQRPPVRTSDPDWSPIISVERVTIGAQPALLTIRRVAYEPAMEAVVGNLLVPVATGLIDLTVFQHTQETGFREKTLLNLALQKYPGEGPQKLARRLGQPYLDDEQHDAQFPNHPLSCVRAALRWLCGLPAEQFAITAPAPALPTADARVELPAVGCSVQVPPRYLLIPDGVLPVPMGVALLSRVILEGADDPQMLDIRHLSGPSLPAEGRQERLLALSKHQVEEWQRQGATQLELKQESIELPSDPDPQLASAGPRIGLSVEVSMLLGGFRTHTVARWLVDHDGRVFRMGIATKPYVPMNEAAADVDLVLRSFRRLPAKKAVTAAWLTSDLRLAPLKRGQTPAPSN